MTSSEFDLPTFADLPLRPELLAAVAELGYTQPSPVQAEAIAPLVEGRDLIGQAATAASSSGRNGRSAKVGRSNSEEVTSYFRRS